MFPFAFLAKLRKLGVKEEHAVELFQEFLDKHSKLGNAENLISTLQVENTKLKNENEFMLKLIDKHMIGIKDDY